MDDDWGFSVEELNSIEENAKKRVAERRGTLPVKVFRDRLGRIGLETQYHPTLVAALKTVPNHEWDQVRRVWTYPEDKLDLLLSAISSLSTVPTNIEIIPPLYLPRAHQQGSFPGLSSVQSSSSERVTYTSGGISPSSKRPATVTVQLYLMNSDLIAARNPYYETIKEACQSVPGRAWNVGERVWTFPKSSLEELVQALNRVPSPSVLIETTPQLVLPESSVLETRGSAQIRRATPSAAPRVALWPTSGKQMDAQNIESQSQDPSLSQNPPVRASVKLSFHTSANVAAKFEYEPRLVATVKSIPKAEWHDRERVWVFPMSSLQEAENKLSNIDGMIVHVEHLEPLVRRALEAFSLMADLSERYDRIPHDLEKRLLPFQRDGVKFALQHGGRSLIADEMGLGKTLQAIAFATCFVDEWPVLVITPSSLRLHWAAVSKRRTLYSPFRS